MTRAGAGTRGGSCVLSVGYPLGARAQVLGRVDDALRATRSARQRAGELGCDPPIAVGGVSAGGNLAAVVANRPAVVTCFQLLLTATGMRSSSRTISRERRACCSRSSWASVGRRSCSRRAGGHGRRPPSRACAQPVAIIGRVRGEPMNALHDLVWRRVPVAATDREQISHGGRDEPQASSKLPEFLKVNFPVMTSANPAATRASRSSFSR